MSNPGTFAKHVGLTFLARGVTTLSSVVIMVAAARLLGPVGKGEYSYLMTLIGLGVQFGGLGIGMANLYFASVDARSIGKLFSTSACVAALASVAYFAALTTLAAAGSPFVRLDLFDTFLLVIAVAFVLLWASAQTLLVGIGEILRYNALSILYGLITLVGMVASFWFLDIRVGAVVAVQFAAAAAVIVALGYHIARQRGLAFRVDRALTTKVLNYGFGVYLSQAAAFLLIRSDFFMVQYYRNATELGLYSLAGDVLQAIVQLQAAINMLLFPKLAAAASDDERRRATTVILRRALIAYAALLVVVVAVIDFGVEMVFGAEFVAATNAIRWLLPGTIALAMCSILQGTIGASGRSLAMLIAPVVALPVNIGLCMLLVPRHGITGAAISATGSFIVMCGVAAFKVYWPHVPARPTVA
jgi:O-antigen/teichoic acid export membrane protein